MTIIGKTTVALIFSILFLSAFSFAQTNEVGVIVGRILSPDATAPTGVGTCIVNFPNCAATIKTNPATTYEGVFAHRLFKIPLAALYLEVPVVGVSNRNLQQGTFTQSFSQVFVTPGVEAKFSLPLISPFVSAGGGFVHYSAVTNLGTLAAAQASTNGTLQIGGGIDLTTPLPFLAIRGEVREFYTGKPSFSPNKQNIFVGGGVVLKF